MGRQAPVRTCSKPSLGPVHRSGLDPQFSTNHPRSLANDGKYRRGEFVPKPLPTLYESTIKWAMADVHRLRRRERAHVILPDGKIILTLEGEESSTGSYFIEISHEHIDLISAHPGCTFVHNHPSGWEHPPTSPLHDSASLSIEDMCTGCRCSIGRMVAVSPTTVYSMTPGPAWGEQQWKALSKRAGQLNDFVRNDQWQQIRVNSLTPEEAERNHYRRLWQQMAAEGHIGYHEEPYNG